MSRLGTELPKEYSDRFDELRQNLMYFQEGYILQEQPVRKQFYNIGGYTL